MSNKDYDLDQFINGTMDSDARAEFERILAQDEHLQAEAEFTAKLRQGLQQQSITPPGDLGLARLQRSIKEYEKEQAQKDRATKSRFWKPVAIAASALLILQSSLLVFNHSEESVIATQTLSGPEQVNSAQIQLIFKKNTPLAELQALLQTIHGTIVHGPSAIGIYHIQLNDDQDLESALQILKTSSWVESVSVR